MTTTDGSVALAEAITEVDEGIIAVLTHDPRASLRRISADVGISEATARARLGRLRSRGTVAVRGFGHPLSVPESISVSVQSTYDDPTLIDLNRPPIDEAHWIARVTTKPILLLEFFVRSTDEVAALVDALGEAPGIASVQAAVTYRIHAGPGAGSEQQNRPGGWAPAPQRALDDVDFALIRYLAKDGRASYTELAREVGLSVPAARRRVVGLTDAGVLSFWTIVDRAESPPLRAQFRALVRPASVAGFVGAATRIPGVTYVVEQATRFPILCELISTDRARLLETVESLRALDGILESTMDPIEVLHIRDVWGQFGSSR